MTNFAPLPKIITTIKVKKKIGQQFFKQKQKRFKDKINPIILKGKGFFGKLKELPQYYRNITAKFIRPLIWLSFVTIFITSLALPFNQAEKSRQVFLASPKNFNNQMNMIQSLIANGHFEAAKKELNKIGNPEFLTKEEKELWQKNYLAWGLSSPQGRDRLIDNWKNFLEEFPNYKIGWIYLGYYQLLNGKEQEAQESFQKAKKIDPGLEEEIKKIATFQFSP